MSVKVYVPRDSAALSMGADQVAEAVVQVSPTCQYEVFVRIVPH